MDDIEKKIINTQNEYFELLQESYGDLIQIYENESTSVKEAVEKYLRRYSILSEREAYLPYKRSLFRKQVTAFWKTHRDDLINFVKKKTNVGLYGSPDDTLTFSYLDEIKRNSLFYDIIVLNDPFYGSVSPKEERFESNATLFYRNILLLWELKKYVSLNNSTVFTVVFPFKDMLTEEDHESLYRECLLDSGEWASEMFGLLEKKTSEEILEALINMPLEDVNTILKSNGILQPIHEAMNYSQNLLSDEEKRDIELYCIEKWGEVNRDYIKGFMLKKAIPGLTMLNYYLYRYHTKIACELKSFPIIAYNEWAPLRRDAKSHPFQVSTDYMYTCAVHRNDKMSALMNLDYETIVSCREKSGSEDYRNFFRRATQDIVDTHENFDEIANEVFARTDELFQKEYRKAIEDKGKRRAISVIGFIKCGLSFAPHLSMLISAIDLFMSGFGILKSLDNKPTVIERIYIRDKEN